jgi:hypothetical protein
VLLSGESPQHDDVAETRLLALTEALGPPGFYAVWWLRTRAASAKLAVHRLYSWTLVE